MSFFGEDEIHFTRSVTTAIETIRTRDFIAQRFVRNPPVINRLWGSDALGAFRLYTGVCHGGELSVLSSASLRYPSTRKGYTSDFDESLPRLYFHPEKNRRDGAISHSFFPMGEVGHQLDGVVVD